MFKYLITFRAGETLTVFTKNNPMEMVEVSPFFSTENVVNIETIEKVSIHTLLKEKAGITY